MANLAKLVVALEAQTAKYSSELDKANRKLGRFEKQQRTALQKVEKGFADLGKKVGVALAAYASVQSLQAIVRISDQYTQLRGRLALVTENTEELASVQQKLFGIAQRTRTEFGGVADLYIKLAQTGKELGATQADLLKFTEGVGNALVVSGANAQSASGALLQLSQALAGGTVRAEEFNSIVEGAPEILRTVARAMDGMDGSLAKLRTAVLAGQVSSEEFFRAFLEGSEDLASQAQALPVTVGQAFTRLQNNVNQAIAGADMSPFVDSINQLSATVSDPQFQKGLAGLLSFMAKTVALAAEVPSAFGTIGNEIGQFMARITGNMSELDRVEDRLEEVNRALEGGSKPFRLYGKGRQELEAMKAALEAQRDAIYATWGIQTQAQLDAYSSKVKDVTVSVRALNTAVADDAITKALERQAKARQKASDSISAMVADLEREIATFEAGAVATLRYDLEHGKLAATFAAAGAAAEPYRQQLISLTQELELMRSAAEGASIATSDFASQNQSGLDANLESFMADFEERFVKTSKRLSVFEEQAARNTQDIIANALVNGFNEGADGILDAFGDMLIQLSAQAVAADIGGKLFGSAGGGEGGGWIGAIASMFSGAAGRAMGGPVQEGRAYRVNENTPNSEWFVPSQNGKIVPANQMGGGGLTVNFALPLGANPASMETQSQIANRMAAALAAARRRNG